MPAYMAGKSFTIMIFGLATSPESVSEKRNQQWYESVEGLFIWVHQPVEISGHQIETEAGPGTEGRLQTIGYVQEVSLPNECSGKNLDTSCQKFHPLNLREIITSSSPPVVLNSRRESNFAW